MRCRSLLLLAGLLLARGPGLAQNGSADPYADKAKSLQQEYTKAQREYFDPLYKAKTDEERNKVQLDPAKDPSKPFLGKFKALAQEAAGHPSAAQAHLMVTQLGPSAGDKQAAIDSYKALIAGYSNTPEAERAVGSLGWAGWSIGQEESRRLLRSVLTGKKTGKLKAAALYTLGSSMLSDQSASADQKTQARQMFQTLKKAHPNSDYAKRAGSALFELERLQIGMAAPDFEATDENGKTFKLSDYKGKVVVLDFWGWW